MLTSLYVLTSFQAKLQEAKNFQELYELCRKENAELKVYASFPLTGGWLTFSKDGILLKGNIDFIATKIELSIEGRHFKRDLELGFYHHGTLTGAALEADMMNLLKNFAEAL